jgi:hypothetical protein
MEDSVEATVDLKTAAKLGMCTPRWVQQLVANGYVSKGERGRYRIIDVVHGRLRQILDDERRSSQSASASRVQDARASEIEARTAERLQSHLAAAQAEAVAVIDEFAGQLRSDLMAIPARVTADIALRRRMEDQIDEAFGAAGDRATAAAALAHPPKPVVPNRRARRAAAAGRKR